MLELAMGATLANFEPSVRFDHAYDVTNLHGSPSSLRSA
jgi:hypothetical protein